jgi:hypothetical protein
MIVIRLFVIRVIGVMSFRRIMRFGFVIGVMRFIVERVMRWISVRIAVRSCVGVVVR